MARTGRWWTETSSGDDDALDREAERWGCASPTDLDGWLAPPGSDVDHRLLSAMAAPRWRLGLTRAPLELKLLARAWSYRRPEEMGF